MSYRSHYKAIYVQNIALRAENARLRAEVSETQSAYHQARQRQDDTERRRARASCLSCGGVILPVAVFAGHRSGDPLPLRLSTARFFGSRRRLHARVIGACARLRQLWFDSSLLGA